MTGVDHAALRALAERLQHAAFSGERLDAQDLERAGVEMLALLDEVRRMREALAVAKTIPDLQREVMMAPLGDRLASANTALRKAYQQLAALEQSA